MRANEFVAEGKMGKVSNQQQQSTVGLNVFSKKIKIIGLHLEKI